MPIVPTEGRINSSLEEIMPHFLLILNIPAFSATQCDCEPPLIPVSSSPMLFGIECPGDKK